MECERFINSYKMLSDVNGDSSRTLGKESIVALYTMTKE